MAVKRAVDIFLSVDLELCFEKSYLVLSLSSWRCCAKEEWGWGRAWRAVFALNNIVIFIIGGWGYKGVWWRSLKGVPLFLAEGLLYKLLIRCSRTSPSESYQDRSLLPWGSPSEENIIITKSTTKPSSPRTRNQVPPKKIRLLHEPQWSSQENRSHHCPLWRSEKCGKYEPSHPMVGTRYFPV